MPKAFVQPAGDPQIGNLATPLNSSPWSTAWINNLPVYRSGLAPERRGREIGMAHGYLLFGPFALLGPLRDSTVPNIAGFLGAAGLVVILSVCLWMYARAGISQPIAVSTTPKVPEELTNAEGWDEFTRGFLVGGLGGALVAGLLMMTLSSIL